MNWSNYLNADRLRPSKRILSSSDNRNAFESDYGRVIFSPATRRMHDKTQVQPLTTDDNVHSRLTHSMETMAIGYSIGIRLCNNSTFIEKTGLDRTKIEREIPIIIQNSCLIHDIGNPPFGHFGETIIQNYFKKLFDAPGCTIKLTPEQKNDFLNYDGNAQGFRVLTKLQYRNDIFGLNLTHAVLATYLKYPCTKKDKSKNNIATKKQGVFSSETSYLNDIADACGLRKADGTIMRHPLTFLVEAADSICYLIMDIEDGFNKKWYSFDFIKEKLTNNVQCKNIIDKIEDAEISGGRDVSDISDVEYMVGFRIGIISYLIDKTISNFLANLDAISKGEYHSELIFDDINNVAKDLQDFCYEHVYSNRNILSLELTGHSVICGLLNYYIDFIWGTPNKGEGKDNDYQMRVRGLLSNSIIKVALIENNLELDSPICALPDYYKLRIIVDFISGMTDQFALNHYQKLSGQKII
jgi:dGTPase